MPLRVSPRFTVYVVWPELLLLLLELELLEELELDDLVVRMTWLG
ncbi:hypothetical protein GCM10026983_39500 [Gracilibacillus alcaliphilus]